MSPSMIIWPTGSSEEKTYSDMILHHAVVWTTLVVGAIGVAAAENSTALIRRSMQEEIDYSLCDEVVATVGELTSETAIRAALQDTVIATEQQRTTLSDGDHRSFACTAWLGLLAARVRLSTPYECLLRCRVCVPRALSLSVRMGVAKTPPPDWPQVCCVS